jgi:serine/threonine protein kinase/Tol biopolymer transport system component
MGAVYRANDEHLSIPVAVKENLFLTEEYGRQFQREAHILAGLRHSNLPHVTDYFSLENQGQYLVMDYIDGEDLRQRMERMGAIPEREAILIGISICDALNYLHTRRPPIVHRDIKPGNIKVTPEGKAVLVDFGLAKIMHGSQATSTGARAMTPGYSPPEQYGTARTDPRTDIYSLGATLYAALTGIIPEDGLARMTGKAKLTNLRDLSPKINRRLADTIEKALEIDPDDRHQGADEIKEDLIECGDLSPVFVERPTIAPPPAEPYTPKEKKVDPKFEDDEDDEVIMRPKERSSRRRRARQQGWALSAAVFVLLLTLFGLVYTQSMGINLPASAAAYFSSSATATAQETQVASADTTLITPEPVSATATATAESSAVLSETPGVEVTATANPSATIQVTPSPTPLGGGLSQIAFASDRTGMMQVWMMNVDGSQRRQITSMRDGACQPTWSPDGMQLAFTSPCAGKQDRYNGSSLFIINVDGTGLTPLPASPEGDYDPAWSPAGRYIAFTSLRNNRPSIFRIDLTNNTIEDLSQSNTYADKQPAWNPTGTEIAFVRQIVTGTIWKMSDNGQAQTIFSKSGNVNDLWPAWSHDGSLLFYSQTSPDSIVPWLVYQRYEDRGKSSESRIPARGQLDPGPVAEVSVSPDGFWLTYEGWPTGTNHDIFIMKINGADQQRLTTDPGWDFGPVWRPMLTQP